VSGLFGTLRMPLPTFRPLSGIDEVSAAEWNRVVGPEAVAFLRWEWLQALEASGSATRATGWEPHHLTWWRGERLVALAPAYLKHHSMGEYIYDFGWAQAARSAGIEYYPKLLVGAPLSPITAPRFVVADGEDVEALRPRLVAQTLEAARAAECSSVHVVFPPKQEAEALEALGLARRTGMQYHWKNPGYRSYDDFLSRFDAKRRHQLKRERAAAATQGIRLRTVRGSELTVEHARLAHGFYVATCEKNPWGNVQLERGFFERAFAALPDHVEMVLAERDGKVVAGAFNVSSRTRLFGRYWGCFEEHPFLHFNVCLYHSIDDCIARGLEAFEPGAGGEHKIARGFEPSPIHSAHALFDRRLDRAVREFLSRERPEIESLVRRGEEIAGMKPWRATTV
jgi:uncharacterized protein